MASDRRLWARRDLFALPGLALMITGLIIEFTGSQTTGSVILFVGILLNTAFVLSRRHSAREPKARER